MLLALLPLLFLLDWAVKKMITLPPLSPLPVVLLLLHLLLLLSEATNIHPTIMTMTHDDDNDDDKADGD